MLLISNLMYTQRAMPDLRHRLQSHDFGFLKIIGGIWGLDLHAPDARAGLPELLRHMLAPAQVQEVVEALPDDARQALDTLILHSGWMPWSRFTRRYGVLREVGPGKRDREKPYLNPFSPTEVLWYRGLIGRDFLRRAGDLQECAYIPDDLLELLPSVAASGPLPPGRAASPGEIAHIRRVSDRILDHCCTLLAALRLEDPQRSPALASWQTPYGVVHALLAAMKLITSSEQPVSEDARPFLEMSRGEALAWLVRGWRESPLFNELRLIPGIKCEGSWHNDPSIARERIIAFLSEIPEKSWWNLDSFIKAIYEREPDFQRPAGDFDTWLVSDALSGDSLSGIQHWADVDGALLRFLITGPMHWLGLIDLASPTEGKAVTAFRFSDWFERLILGQPYQDAPEETQLIEIKSDGILIASSLTPRLARYQVSRFCLWIAEAQGQYTYQLTPASLKAAAQQGLTIAHLESLFKKYAQTIPPNLLQALRQWDQHAGQVRICPGVILQVETPHIMQALRDSPAGRFIEEPLGPTAAIIHPDAIGRIRAALARLGYLTDVASPEGTISHASQLPETGLDDDFNG